MSTQTRTSENEGKNRQRLSRERIVAAAMRIMDAEGLDAVSMRRVAHELGVEAMSLYHHVKDKEDLLDGICELVMSEFRFPEPSDDWERVARDGARAWRDVVRSHPSCMRLFAERRKPVTRPEALRPMEFALSVIRSAGLSERDAVLAFRAFGGYIQGSIMTEISPMVGEPSDGREHHHTEMAELLSPEEFPCLREAFPFFDECEPDEQFEFGLDLMIAGIRAKAASGKPRVGRRSA
jgi:AcrR family transcriptional regulator